MGSSVMASAAAGVIVSAPYHISNSSASKSSLLMMFNGSNSCSNCPRLVAVARAAEEAAAPVTTAAPQEPADSKPINKPPPIGPKRGTKVKILRKESYWYNGIGSVVAVDQDPKTRYPVVVRFKQAHWLPILEEASGVKVIEDMDKFPRLKVWTQNFKEAPVIKDNLPDPEKMLFYIKRRW